MQELPYTCPVVQLLQHPKLAPVDDGGIVDPWSFPGIDARKDLGDEVDVGVNKEVDMSFGEGIGVKVVNGRAVAVGISGKTRVLVRVGRALAGGSSVVGYGVLVGKVMAGGSATLNSCCATPGCDIGGESPGSRSNNMLMLPHNASIAHTAIEDRIIKIATCGLLTPSTPTTP
jgi:hypothetical protein